MNGKEALVIMNLIKITKEYRSARGMFTTFKSKTFGSTICYN